MITLASSYSTPSSMQTFIASSITSYQHSQSTAINHGGYVILKTPDVGDYCNTFISSRPNPVDLSFPSMLLLPSLFGALKLLLSQPKSQPIKKLYHPHKLTLIALAQSQNLSNSLLVRKITMWLEQGIASSL